MFTYLVKTTIVKGPDRHHLTLARRRLIALISTYASVLTLACLMVSMWIHDISSTTTTALSCLLLILIVIGHLFARDYDEAIFKEDEEKLLSNNLFKEQNPSQEAAYQLLRLNQMRVNRYYNQNMSRDKSIFYLGVSCLVVSVLMFGFAGIMVILTKEPGSQTNLIAILGAISGFFTNVVGYQYLRIFSESSKQFLMFHRTLTRTSDIMLANLLSSTTSNHDDNVTYIVRSIMKSSENYDLNKDIEDKQKADSKSSPTPTLG